METQKFYRILAFECRASFEITLKKLLCLFLLIVVFSLDFFNKAKYLAYSASVGDCLFYILKGNEVFVPELGQPFEIPVIWYLIYLFIFYIILDYTNTTFYTMEKQSFIKIKSRYHWWYAKCIMCFLITVLCFLTILVGIISVSAFYGNLSFTINPQIAALMCNVRLIECDTVYLWSAVLFVPMFTVFAMSMMQMFLSILLKALYSYFLICIYLMAATYYHTYFLAGNFMIPIRNKVIYANGYETIFALVIDILFVIFAFFTGRTIMKKYDVI